LDLRRPASTSNCAQDRGHRPPWKQARVDIAGPKIDNVDTTVVVQDSGKGRCHDVATAFEQLHKQVVVADQCAGDAVALIVAPSRGQNSNQGQLIVAERPRRIDQLHLSHAAARSLRQ
jgi:hypothetical protein